MTTYLLIAFTGFIAIFVLKFNRNIFYALAEKSVSVLNDLLSAEDDEKKLELIQSSTGKLVVSLLKSVGVVLLVLASAAALLYFYTRLSNIAFADLNLGSWQSILALSIGASLPLFIPNKKTGDYSELSQLLHRLVLNNYTLGYKLFLREKKNTKKKGLTQNPKFVIVTGLARAGTTSMLNDLLINKTFGSLSYANMPFLLAPNLWRKIYNPKNTVKKERSHKDGLKIGLDSTEALEEYFFKTITNDSFIEENTLKEHQISETNYHDYLDYQKVVTQNNDKIYLSKNNNFLLRYESLRASNKDFLAVVLVRHPLYHAASLLEKHLSFSKLQEQDPFVLEYMNWLGHHEFGLNQKVFGFNGTTPPTGNKNSLDFWLKVWINYYAKVLEIKDAQMKIVSYENYCSQPNAILNTIEEQLNLTPVKRDLQAHNNQREVKGEYSENLLSEALKIYNQVLE